MECVMASNKTVSTANLITLVEILIMAILFMPLYFPKFDDR